MILRRPLRRSCSQNHLGRQARARRACRLLAAAVEPLEGRLLLTSVVVNTTADSTDPTGSTVVSLRDAIAIANKSTTATTITFSPTVFATARTITLDTIAKGGLELSNTHGPISILGPAAGLSVVGNDGGTTLTVDAGVTASLSGLSISAGPSTHSSIPNPGAALVNSGKLTVTASSITDSPDGGATNSGTLVVQNSTISGNSGGMGAGLYSSGTLVVQISTISGNSGGMGAGLYSSGASVLQNCTISNNSAGNGGGLYNSGTATLTGCAFFANVVVDSGHQSTSSGGAINNAGTLKLTNSTLSGNSADGGAAIYNYTSATAAVSDCTITANNAGAIANRGSVTLANSIVAGNTAFDGSGDVSGAIKSLGHNLIGKIDGNSSGWVSSDLTGTDAHPLDPDLAPLAAHGGPTATQFPLAGSPAIGAGSVALVPAGVTTDQRGFARVVGGKVDIGAVELQKSSVVTVTPPAAQNAVAGVPAVIKLGSFTDPGGKGPFTVDVNWGDGSPDTVYSETAAGSLGSQTHTYIITGSLKGSITVTDASGDVSQLASLPVTSAAAVPVTITVNTTADQTDPAGSKTVSLRDAVNRADAGYGPVTIAFDSKVFATNQTIKLGSPLELDDNRFGAISLAGPAARVTLSGQTIVIDAGISASISRLTITGANSTHGGIENAGTLTLTGSTITGNTAMHEGVSRSPYFGGGFGGGIDNTGTATIIDTTISDNNAVGGYGSGGGGGGIANSGTLTLTDSTVSGNNAGYGAGILNDGAVSNPPLTLINSTIASNVASGGGGGLENNGLGKVAIFDCTLSGNTGGQSDPQNTASGGIANSYGTVFMANTIVAANIDTGSAAPDMAGPAQSKGHNLIGNTAGSTGWLSSDLTGSAAHPLDPDLAPLGNYGGPTQTRVPLPNSPAIAAGSVALIPAGVTTDQRGFTRVVNGRVDIGAVEVQASTAKIVVTATSGLKTVEGTSAKFALGSFTESGATGPYLVDVNWGDGSADDVSHLSAPGALPADSHTFAQAGTYHGTLAVVDAQGHTAAAAFTVTVADAPLRGSAQPHSGVAVGVPFAWEVAVVTDANPDSTESNFSAAINWGDGTTSTGVVASLAQLSGSATGPYGVTGTHTYAKAGTYKFTVTVSDIGGQTLTVSSTITCATAKSIVVNTAKDQTDPSGSATVSLRDAVAMADKSTTPTSITFDPKVFATAQTITLSGSDLELSSPTTVSIAGPAAGVTISGNGKSMVFAVDQNVNASLTGLTITDGNPGIGGNDAGGIANSGILFLTNSSVRDSVCTNFNAAGGGIANFNFAVLTGDTVSANQAPNGDGGGVFNGGKMTLIDSTVADNTTHGMGGGIDNDGVLTLLDSTIAGNTASGVGGGIDNDGQMTLTDCTVAKNTADHGGGIFNVGALTLLDSTISGNTAAGGFGGGIYNSYHYHNPTGIVTAANTIIAGNSAAEYDPDVVGLVDSLGFNLVGQTDGSHGWISSDLTGTSAKPLNPKLGPLANNGGPTQTLLPLSGSPAINHGSNALVPTGLTTDQRGKPRIAGGTVDIGSVEVR